MPLEVAQRDLMEEPQKWYHLDVDVCPKEPNNRVDETCLAKDMANLVGIQGLSTDNVLPSVKAPVPENKFFMHMRGLDGERLQCALEGGYKGTFLETSNSFLQNICLLKVTDFTGEFLNNPDIRLGHTQSDKFRQLMLKKQKREARKPKNVLNEFKTEDVSGQEFDFDSVLQSLEEVKEDKKGKAKKKNKTARKKGQGIAEKDHEGQTIEAKETEEEELEDARENLDKTEAESEEMLNQPEILCEERLDLNEVQMESELEALVSLQARKQAELLELWDNDRSLIDTKGKEMSDLLSKLEDVEEEKAAIEKKVAELDSAARELQDRREKLVTGMMDKDEKVKKLMEKKERLENFIEQKVMENKEAKYQLEREIEQLQRKIEDFGKAKMGEKPESNNLNLEWLESVERKIEAEEKELECPVCLEV